MSVLKREKKTGDMPLPDRRGEGGREKKKRMQNARWIMEGREREGAAGVPGFLGSSFDHLPLPVILALSLFGRAFKSETNKKLAACLFSDWPVQRHRIHLVPRVVNHAHPACRKSISDLELAPTPPSLGLIRVPTLLPFSRPGSAAHGWNHPTLLFFVCFLFHFLRPGTAGHCSKYR